MHNLMLSSVIFWAIILGVMAFWAFAETLFVRGVVGLWRGSSAGIVLKLLATVLVVADLAFCIYFWNGTVSVPLWCDSTADECTTIWTAGFTWGNILCLGVCTVFSPIVCVFFVLQYCTVLYYEFAWESLMMGAYWAELLFAICLCAGVVIVPFLRAWLMWRISGKSFWKTGVVLLASWLPPVPLMSAHMSVLMSALMSALVI